MHLDELKERLAEIEPSLPRRPFALLHVVERDGRGLHVALTDRLRARARRGRVWKSPAFLTALKNAGYGLDDARARSRGGQDGIFLLDRGFTPRNAMMRKLFDHYLDKPGSGAAQVTAALEAPLDALLPVRVVSHHMRLLGVLLRGEAADWLVLVDYDDT